jgi:hypothetical protein
VSVLLVGNGGELAGLVADRMLAQGDEVRAIATEGDLDGLAGKGVHIARGPFFDADLVERAAQNVRTVVLFDTTEEVAKDVVEGARAARVDRIVQCSKSVPEPVLTALRDSSLEYVVLQMPRKGRFRKGVPDDSVAEAIDAADDMGGRLRLELDLNERDAWETLKVEAPLRA